MRGSSIPSRSVDEDLLRDRKFLSMLADSTSLDILLILLHGPASTRGISRILGVSESIVSRKLREMERLDVVEGEWTNVRGVNVKLYHAKVRNLSITIDPAGVRISRGPGSLRLHSDYMPVTGALIGRSKEMEILERNNFILVTGMPGVGKSYLVAYYARSTGLQVAWFNITGSTTLPLIARRLSLVLRDLGDSRLYDALEEGFLEVQQLIDIIVDSIKAERFILVLDDYHECLDPSIELLVKRLSREEGLKGKVIVISRSKLGFHVPSSVVLNLGNLPEEDIVKLGGILGLSEDEAIRVHRVLGGNPQYIITYAKLRGKGASILDAVGDVKGYVARESLRGLSDVERRILELISILAQPAPFRLLKSLKDLGFSESALKESLSNLEDKGLLARSTLGYTIADKLVADVIRENALGLEELHLIAARYYESMQSEEGYLEAIQHYFKASSYDNMVRCMYKLISRFSQAYIPPRVYFELLDVIAPTVELKGSLESKAMLKLIQGVKDKLRGDYEGSVDNLEVASRLASTMGSYEILALAKLEMGIAYRYMSRYEDALRVLSEALALSRKLRSKKLRMTALYNIAAIKLFQGDLGESRRILEELLYSYRSSGDIFSETLIKGWLGMLERASLNIEDSRGLLEDVIRVFERLGLKHSLAIAYREYASTLHVAGEHNKAIEYLEKALAIIDENEYPSLKAGIYIDMSIYKSLTGDAKGGEEALSKASRILNDARLRIPEYDALTSLAHALIEYRRGGDPEGYLAKALEQVDKCNFYRRAFIAGISEAILYNLRPRSRLRRISQDILDSTIGSTSTKRRKREYMERLRSILS